MVPFYKSAAMTLLCSSEVLARAAVGKLDVAAADYIIDRWQRTIFSAGRCAVRGVGLEHTDAQQPVLLMSNHRSLLDIPSVFATWPGSVRMVAKSELGRVPLWGHAMKKMGFVFVDRGQGKKAAAQLDDARACLAQGVSVWIAPEGTRSRDGSLQPFKKGGFHTAIKLGVPIVPVWIEGTGDVIQPDSFAVKTGGDVVVRYGPRIDVANKTPDDLPALMEQVQAALLSLRDQTLVELG
jgi:1-acyl-sn-glycerol-3-phosphate acyltransferase